MGRSCWGNQHQRVLLIFHSTVSPQVPEAGTQSLSKGAGGPHLGAPEGGRTSRLCPVYGSVLSGSLGGGQAILALLDLMEAASAPAPDLGNGKLGIPSSPVLRGEGQLNKCEHRCL